MTTATPICHGPNKGAACGTPQAGSSSLDPQETNAHFPTTTQPNPQSAPDDFHCGFHNWSTWADSSAPLLPAEGHFRHGGWQPLRRRIADALATTQVPLARQERFVTCGSQAVVQWSPELREYRIACTCCHDRWCIPCNQQIASYFRDNVRDLIGRNPVRLVTLTLRHSLTPLRDQLRRLHDSFTKLRRRDVWTEHVTAGAAVLEIKLSDRDGLWHVHLHCLCIGTFLPQRELSAAWHAITGDSSIVDVRQIEPDRGVAYVGKYLTKPVDTSIYHQLDRLQEAIVSLRGSRRMTTFGTWRGKPLCKPPKSTATWETRCRLTDLLDNARAGDPDALAILKCLALKYPSLAEAACSSASGP